MTIETIARDFVVPGVSDTLPGAPDAGKVRLYGGQVGGKPMLFMRAPLGRAQPLQASLGRARIAWACANGDATAISVFGLTISTTGTATAAAVGSSTFYASQKRVDALVTVASTSAVAGFRYNQPQFYRGDAAGRGGFLFTCRWGASTGVATSTTRGFCGFASGGAAPTDVEPSSINNVLGFGWDSADSNISFMNKTGAGGVTKQSLGASFPRPSADNTSVYECSIYSAPNGSTIEWEITNLTTGDTTRGSSNSALPANTTFLAPRVWMSVGGTSSVIGVSLMNFYLETDT